MLISQFSPKYQFIRHLIGPDEFCEVETAESTTFVIPVAQVLQQFPRSLSLGHMFTKYGFNSLKQALNITSMWPKNLSHLKDNHQLRRIKTCIIPNVYHTFKTDVTSTPESANVRFTGSILSAWVIETIVDFGFAIFAGISGGTNAGRFSIFEFLPMKQKILDWLNLI